MTRAARQPAEMPRLVFKTLAALAIALKIMIPPGFMVANTNDTSFAIVMCTAQGAVTVEPGKALPGHDDRDTPPEKKASDSPCAFAANSTAAPPSIAADVRIERFVAYLPLVPPTAPSLVPGRGLAAPPLPARGPPSLLI